LIYWVCLYDSKQELFVLLMNTIAKRNEVGGSTQRNRKTEKQGRAKKDTAKWKIQPNSQDPKRNFSSFSTKRILAPLNQLSKHTHKKTTIPQPQLSKQTPTPLER